MKFDHPQKLSRNSVQVGDVLSLIQRCFAFMDGRIDPPSSMNDLSVDDVSAQCTSGEVWVLGDTVIACVFLKEREDWLYLSKLAVDETARGQGLARILIDHAFKRASELGLHGLELETRVELLENHAGFWANGI